MPEMVPTTMPWQSLKPFLLSSSDHIFTWRARNVSTRTVCTVNTHSSNKTRLIMKEKWKRCNILIRHHSVLWKQTVLRTSTFLVSYIDASVYNKIFPTWCYVAQILSLWELLPRSRAWRVSTWRWTWRWRWWKRIAHPPVIRSKFLEASRCSTVSRCFSTSAQTSGQSNLSYSLSTKKKLLRNLKSIYQKDYYRKEPFKQKKKEKRTKPYQILLNLIWKTILLKQILGIQSSKWMFMKITHNLLHTVFVRRFN